VHLYELIRTETKRKKMLQIYNSAGCTQNVLLLEIIFLRKKSKFYFEYNEVFFLTNVFLKFRLKINQQSKSESDFDIFTKRLNLTLKVLSHL
jgi:hypothetical protein